MSLKYPLISVVMLNYNGLKYLKRTIPPILKLDYPNYEFIIVDNGSKDGSIEFIKKFKKIRLIENGENLGYSKGKNIGVKHAKGEYVLLLDNDILIKRRYNLKELIPLMNKNVGLIQIPLLDFGKNVTNHFGHYNTIYGFDFNRRYIKIKSLINYKSDFYKISAPTGGCFFFKKNVWNKLKGFDESQGFNIDDIDIGPRAYLYGYENFVYTRFYFIHLGLNNAEKNEDYINRFKLLFSGHIRSIIKNYKLKNLLLTLPLGCLFYMIKAIKYSIIRKNIRVFFAFLYSVNLFLKNLPDTLKQRKIIQSKRVVKDDLFLKIKPPKFD